MNIIKSIIALLALCISATACKESKEDNSAMTFPALELSNMDTNVEPAKDFYMFVNGGWDARTEIPDDESRWGSFNELRERNDSMTLALVDKALSNTKINPNTDEGKVVTFFKTAMDVDKLNENGTRVLDGVFEAIAGIDDAEGLQEFMIMAELYGGTMFGHGVFADLKNSNVNALYMGPGQLGLPEREYYIGTDADSKDKREKYVKHITRMLQFLGDSESDAAAQADRILAFETKLAEAMRTKEENRNPKLMYNPHTVDELQSLVPAVDWAGYYEGIGAKGFEHVIVSEPDYMKRIQEVFTDGDLGTLKEFLRWSVFNDASAHLTEEIEAANFDFYGKELQGSEKQKPRNERVLQLVNGVLGEALGKLYVDEYFPSKAKQVAEEMVGNVRKAFSARIDNLDWMSDSTKVMAQKKLDAFRVKIGYPNKWKDYSDLEIKGWEEGGSLYQNLLNARKWNYEKDIAKIGEDVDKEEWGMNPQTVNAYYNPLNNEIVFPAAILQPPFFNFEADAAMNYGGMGAVIGHEISHGFDDQGAQFDADGNLENWWTKSDLEKFEERGDQLIAQYDSYEPLPGINVNGEFTLGENIGDLGGVNVAYDGLKLHLDEHGDPGEIDGFTPAQRFFISWGTIWRTKMRDEAMKNRIKTDPHSPGMYRAVGPVVNVDAFYEAFDIKEGDPMYKAPEERVRIW